jgi:uncharacterized membrane protein
VSRSKRTLVLALAILCGFASAAHAQTQASCVFTLFPLSLNLPKVCTALGAPSTCTTGISPSGINDYGTIVGSASLPNGINVAFIRWANGGVTFPLGTASSSALADRNDKGTSIGDIAVTNPFLPHLFLLNGTTVTDISLGLDLVGQSVNGINNWGSIVGTYFTDFPNGLTGFKRLSNGGFFNLPFFPSGINDSGIIVGDNFVFHNGQQATLSFPNASQTTLVGISNAGVIVGNALANGSSTAFLYENGVFKVISVPNSPAHSTNVIGISPKLGLIVGTNSGTSQGFTGVCH